MPIARIRDLDVYYEITAPERGNPVLCIHGLGSSTQDWTPQLAALSREHTVITYDVRGHGQSGKPRGRYSVRQFAEDAAALIQHLEPGPVSIMGISMGGMIAFQLAIDFPHLVKSLVIVNSGPEMVLRTWKQRVAIYRRFVIVRLMGMRAMAEVLATALLPSAEHAGERATFIERWARNEPGAYLRALRALIGWSVTDRLPSIRCPTLIVAADQDYTPVAYKEYYARFIRGASIVIVPDSRHMLPVERPTAFNKVVTQFLDSGVHAPASVTAAPMAVRAQPQ
jgi:pimeloyl-ACP methyl ester carboxylesterase